MTSPVDRATRDLVLDRLLSNAPVSVFAYDETGRCVFSEGAALHAMGRRPGELVGQNLWQLYGHRPEIVERLKRALQGTTFRETDTVAGRAYDTWYLPLTEGGAEHPMGLGISVDVTDRAAAEAGEQLYRAFAEAAPQFVAFARVDGSVLFVNPGGRRLAGIPDGVDVTTLTITDFLTPDGLRASAEVEQPAVVRDGRWSGEATLRHWPTGEGIPVQVSSFLVSDPETGAPMALATVQSDLREVVAGREAVQEQIAHQRGLLHHLHEAQETERARIAADIHDDTVQVMAAVNLRLQSLRRSLEPVLSPEQAAALGTMDATVREASGRLRRLLVELDQPAVDAADVGAALRKTADESSVVGGPSVTVDVRVEGDPSPIVARALVRIAHEALTNVRKHAEADTALVRLGQVAGDYLLQVVDDGRGLAPDTDLRAGTHRGVRGMRERAESVGGSLTVAPRSVGGVVVEARVPNLLGYPDAGGAASGPRIFLEQVMETITDCYCALDADWRYVYLNRAGYALLRRDPADPVVGKLVWDEFEIGPEFAAAWHRAREEQVEVEVTGYVEAWDIWIHNRVLPTAGGLSIFARDVSDEVRATRATRVHARLVQAGRALSHAIAAGGQDDATVVRNAAAAIVETWPVRGLRVGWPGGAVEAGDLTGPVRRVPLAVAGREVGEVEIVGEDEPVDPDLLHLLAVRLSAAVSGSRDDLVEAETSRTSDP